MIVPVWIFYTLDFLVIIILSRLGIEAAPSLREVVRTFLCIDGYGWIIRVFVLLAIVTPPLIQLEKRVTNTYMYYGILIGIMFLTAYLSTLVKQRESFWVSDVWEGCILSLLGYIPPYLAGLRMRFATVKERFVFVLVFAIASIAIYIFPGIPFAPEQFKYPPQIPFIVYGIATSSLIWWCQPLLRLLTKSRLLVFIGQNTIWIYLYHVLLLLFVFKICKIWWMQYFIVYGCSVLIFIVQYYLSRKSNKVLNKYLVG